jgi:hypothetical protein
MSLERSERERAYFALLSAREELTRLERYEDYLRSEGQRLRRAMSEDAALRETVEPRMRRVLASVDRDLIEVIERRTAIIADELSRLPDRIAAAHAFVDECERTSRLLGGAG